MPDKALLPLITVVGWLSITACLLSGDFFNDMQATATLTDTPETGLLKTTQTAQPDTIEPMLTSTEMASPTTAFTATLTSLPSKSPVPTNTFVPPQDTETPIPPSLTATQVPPTAVPPTTNPGAPSSAVVYEFTADVLALVNQVRCANGVTALGINNQLREAALRHSMDMVQHNFVSHTGSDSSDVADRITATGYSWVMVAENIAAGMQAPQEAFDLWMNSPGHRDNIMHPDLREMGLAVVSMEGTEYGWYWTQVFGSQGQPAISCADAGF